MTRLPAPTLRGQHWIHGFFFDLGAPEATRAERRALRLWHPGARVYRYADALIVLLAEPRWQDCRLTPAYPLVKIHDGYCSVALDERAWRAIAPAPDSVVVMRAGAPAVYPLDPRCADDPAAWLDVSAFQRIEVEPLGAAPLPPPQAAVGGAKASHEIFTGAKLQPAAGLRELLADLERRQEALAPEPRGGWLGGLLAAFGQLFGQRSGSASKPPGSARTSPQDQAGAGASLGDRLRAWGARFIVSSTLGSLLSRRQAAYFRRLLAMFDAGDLNEALRHAVPLASARDAFAPIKPALGLPAPRRRLTISRGRVGSLGAIGFGEQFYEYLRKLYRSAFERLDRQGRIQEAAFVLAELLQATEEAVSYLERKGELRLAAELAEGREARPALVIRQWLIAGDAGRAVAIARRTGAFAAAVTMLEQNQPALAKKLRLLWAGVLAEGGDYAAAVDVVWPLEEARRLADRWLELAIEQGGETGARMLARRLVGQPETLPAARPRIEALLASAEPDDALARRAFTLALAGAEQSPTTLAVGRAAVRALLRDLGTGAPQWSPDNYKRARKLIGHNALAADVPDLSRFLSGAADADSALARREPPLDLRFADRGTSAIADAALLPDGRLLVALGEAGVRLVSPQGKALHHFAVPAHHLVLADSGAKAIALARRGDHMRLAKLDLARRTFSHWQEMRLDRWAARYDGSLWFVSVGERLIALDAQADASVVLWQVPDLPGVVSAIQLHPDRLGLLLGSGKTFQSWCYELPALLLRQRRLLVAEGFNPKDVIGMGLRADGAAVGLQVLEEANAKRQIQVVGFMDDAAPAVTPLGLGPPRVAWLGLTECWLALTALSGTEVAVYLFDHCHRVPGRLRAKLEFPTTEAVLPRFCGDHGLLVVDPSGRVVRLSLADGTVLADWRL